MYFVIELQTNAGQTGNLVYSYANRADADSKYYAVLAAAATSQIEKHAAILVSEEGFPLLHQCYIHNQN